MNLLIGIGGGVSTPRLTQLPYTQDQDRFKTSVVSSVPLSSVTPLTASALYCGPSSTGPNLRRSFLVISELRSTVFLALYPPIHGHGPLSH